MSFEIVMVMLMFFLALCGVLFAVNFFIWLYEKIMSRSLEKIAKRYGFIHAANIAFLSLNPVVRWSSVYPLLNFSRRHSLTKESFGHKIEVFSLRVFPRPTTVSNFDIHYPLALSRIVVAVDGRNVFSEDLTSPFYVRQIEEIAQKISSAEDPLAYLGDLEAGRAKVVTIIHAKRRSMILVLTIIVACVIIAIIFLTNPQLK